MHKSLFIFLGVVLALTAFFHLRSDNIPAIDSFYHLRHAAIYQERGVFNSAFPWLPYSIIGKFSSDIWYGFHLLLIPFTFIKNQVLALKLSGIAITASALILVYFSLARLGVSRKSFWPFFALLASPLTFYRLMMARPHVLSVGIAALFFSFAMAGSSWGIFFTSFALAFFHASLFWLPILIFAVLAVVKLVFKKTFEWRQTFALFFGIAAGWLARPHPFGAARIVYEQVFRLILEKQKGVPLHFGMELMPLAVKSLSSFLPFIIIWLAAISIFLSASVGRKRSFSYPSALWGSGTLSIIFFAMTLAVAQRSFDFWVVFGTMFIALVFSDLIGGKTASQHSIFSQSTRKAIASLGIAIFAFMTIYGIRKQGEFLEKFAWNPYRFKLAAEWLKKNSEPGSIVFHTSWDYFPELFFWSPANRYIGGMDPIFQYSYDPKLYWRQYYFEVGKATRFTCPAVSCGPDEMEESYTALKKEFQASYLFLSKFYDGNLYAYLKTDTRFLLQYEGEETAIFELK